MRDCGAAIARQVAVAFVATACGFAVAAPPDWRSLLRDGVTAREKGNAGISVDLLSKAFDSAPQGAKPQVASELGASLTREHRWAESESILQSALQGAEGPVRAALSADLGNLALARGDRALARARFLEAEELDAADQAAVAALRLNRARAEDGDAKLSLLEGVLASIPAIPDASTRVRIAVNLAAQARGARPALEAAALSQAALDLDAADKRLVLEALDAIGRMNEARGDPAKALLTARRGVDIAQSQPAGDPWPDVTFRLYWRMGRILAARGALEAARTAYRNAAERLESIRQDIPIEYEDGRSSFQETLRPVFMGLADVTLAASRQGSPGDEQSALRAAIHAVELTRQSELQDYLGERCSVEAVTGDVEDVPEGTAVLYPLLLANRLELLARFHGRISRKTVQVPGREVAHVAALMAEDLTNYRSEAYLGSSRRLYRWLVAPFEEDLAREHVDTLVFAGDGSLRRVPLAALNDGRRFVVERFAVATVTGLSMTEMTANPSHHRLALLAGLSEPGPVVSKVSDLLPALAGDAAAGVEAAPVETRGMRLKEALALPGVKHEIEDIRKIMPGTEMLDSDFTLARFARAAESGDYRIIHIASHGVFGGSASSSFILTYDDLLTMNGLERLLQGSGVEANPIELLTLSACETAQGNERAPLGIAGAAVKARARSVMGTLWPVSDDAAQAFMRDFYAHLARGESKARAMQAAQRAIMADSRYAHPFFWAPFIVVGNWM